MKTDTFPFRNWSGQYASAPTASAIPESVADLQEIVRAPGQFPSPAVAVGSGHSNSGCNVVNGGTAVHMKGLHYLGEPTADDVTVGAGVQLFEVHRYLAARGRQLPFTPEIGNATVGSAACCCLKDASIGRSSGIATGMIKAVRYVDAYGNPVEMRRGDAGWEMLMSSHGLFGIIHEVVLDVMPMTLVVQNYLVLEAHDPGLEVRYRRALAENDGIFGLLNASTGKFILETRNFSADGGRPSGIENIYNRVDRNLFKYFNPIMGAVEANWYSALVRRGAMLGFQLMRLSFPRGRRTFKNLKPIDYSDNYGWRWDFHFWAFPVATFPTVVLPAFLSFLRDYKRKNAKFDEKGLMACYRIRVENKAILSPSYDDERMTLDPLRPMTDDVDQLERWDEFCDAYNEFAVQQGGKCTFNQTKVLTRSQVERAFGEKWDLFKQARERADPDGRFLSGYFRDLMYGVSS